MIRASATVGNFGPGFDTLSLALAGHGDHIDVRPADEDTITVTGVDAERIPTEWESNIAAASIDHLRRRTGIDEPVHVAIKKGQPGGSGLGSSAASAAGAALAFADRFRPAGLSLDDLLAAAIAGEALAAGGSPDDVAAVLVGGLAVVRRTGSGLEVTRVAPPKDLHIAVAAPRMRLKTEEMRALVPHETTRADAVWNLGQVARMVAAFHEGDVAAIGACLEDRIAVPPRAARLPHLHDAIEAALAAGAAGACLSGSGPAVIAVCDSAPGAGRAAKAMADAVDAIGMECGSFTAEPEREVPYAAVLR